MSNDRRFRVLVFGTRWLGAELITRLYSTGHEVALVTTSAEDRSARRAFELGLPWTAKPDDVPLQALDFPWRPELILSAHSFRVLPPWVLSFARLGAIGYHPSLLPAYKGRRAIDRALEDGQRILGGTVYWMTEALDAGPAVIVSGRKLQGTVQALPGETAGQIWRRALAPLGEELLAAAVEGQILGR
jgi:methionyl-tRNA formyltransferase